MYSLENATCVVASDLHLEHGGFSWSPNWSGKVLALCGDILQVNLWDTPRHKEEFDHFFNVVSEQFEHVLYVLGNHEYYGSVKEDVVAKVREKLRTWPNVQLLDNEHVDIDGVRYIGSTLWASANNVNPRTVSVLENIREFSIIRSNSRMVKSQKTEYEMDPITNRPVTDAKGMWVLKSVTPVLMPDRLGVQGMVNMHNQCVAYLDRVLNDAPKDLPVVVLTHHAPSIKSVRPPFNTPESFHLNGMFASECEHLIRVHRPVAWLHGHLHNRIGYNLAKTLVVVSTKGYPQELMQVDWQPVGVSLSRKEDGEWASSAFTARGPLNYNPDSGHLI